MYTKIKKNSESVVRENQLEFNHEFNWENTEIINYAPGYQKRLTSEMISARLGFVRPCLTLPLSAKGGQKLVMMHIKFNKFNTNKKEDIFTLNRIYFALLSRLIS